MTPGGDAQATLAAVVVDEWVRAGVTDVVVSPGSRSTPLTTAIAADGRLTIHVVLDERSAGFFGLGLGQATGRPAVVVTTSGTAAVELHPSVVEASQAGIPLVVATADRPAELHGVGAPQTVEQEGLFGPCVRWSVAIGVADRVSAPAWRSLASRAVAVALGGPEGPGPVHINLAFREPLLGSVVDPPAGREGGQPWHRVTVGVDAPPPELVDRLAAMAGRRGLIVVGAGVAGPGAGGPGAGVAGPGAGGPGAAEAVHRLAAVLGWPVLADPRSGCRTPGPLTVAAADALLRSAEVALWRPEIVLRLGAPWASRALASWLGNLGPSVEQVLVDPFGRWADPERIATTIVRCDGVALCRAVTAAAGAVAGGAAGPDRAWTAAWSGVEAAAQVAFDETLAGRPDVTEPGVARTLVDVLPAGATLFVSSSMPVRDVEWFGRPRTGLTVLANRGANGIDGIVSTALGVAAGERGPVVALVGDLAFVYDAGALLWAVDRGVDLVIVVVDNDGGGIFSFLPQATALPPDRFERLWGTPHGIDLAALAGAYRVPASSADRADQVGPAVLAAMAGRGVRLVHVRTDRWANVARHGELEAAVAAATAGRPRPTAPAA